MTYRSGQLIHGQPNYRRETHTPEQTQEFTAITQIRRFVDVTSFDQEWMECFADLQRRNPGFTAIPLGALGCTYASNNDVSRMLGQKDPRFGRDLNRTKDLQRSLGAIVESFVAREGPEPIQVAPYFVLMGDRLAIPIRNYRAIGEHRSRLFRHVAKKLKVDTGQIGSRKAHISAMRVGDPDCAHTIVQQKAFPTGLTILPPSVTQTIRFPKNSRLRRR